MEDVIVMLSMYRFWDEKNNRYIEWEEISCWNDHDKSYLYEMLNEEEEGITPYRSKGVADEKGKEIYEGDILWKEGFGCSVVEVTRESKLEADGNYNDGKVNADYKIKYTIIGDINGKPESAKATEGTIGYWLNK